MNVSLTISNNGLFVFYFTALPKGSETASKSTDVLNMCCHFCIVSMQFVFPFLVFFVLLFARTFNTEPLLVLGRGREDPNTGPEDKDKTHVRCVNGFWLTSHTIRIKNDQLETLLKSKNTTFF